MGKAKEELLLEQLNRLGEEKESKDAENIELRNQLKVLKEKLKAESDMRQSFQVDQRKQEEIKRKEIDHQTLKFEVERKRKERKQKQQEELEERQRSLHEAEMKRQQVEKDLAHRE